MTPTSTPSRPKNDEATRETEDRVRRRAYELYEQRGRESGHDMDDWLQAEAEITGHRQITAA